MNLLAANFGAGYDDAYGRLQDGHEQRARVRAGRALGAGDTAAASGELYNSGLLQEGAGVQKMQEQSEDRQLDNRRQEQTLQHQQVQERGQVLLKAANALSRVPAGQRKAVLDRLMPVFQGMGLPTEAFANLSEDQLTDENLRAFGAEITEKIKTYSSGGRTVAIDEGALQQDFNNPNAVRVLDEDPLASEYRRAQIDATQARAGASGASAEAAKARAYRTMHPVARGSRATAAGGVSLSAIEAELRRRGKLP